MHINDLLKTAVERKASDLHLKVGAFPVLRIDGVLKPMTDTRRLLQEDTMAIINVLDHVLPPEGKVQDRL